MATLINNSGVQYYANKMVQAENRKVGSKSLPTALNDIDSALDEMKNLFDAEYGSALDMKLENTENIFSVGTGSGVDKKADVENSFTDVELKGDTLVNLVTTKGGNLFGTSGSGITFNRTYNADLTRCIYTTKEEMSSYITLRTGSKERIKPNTTYTLIFNIFKNNISELKKGISIRGSSDPYYTQTNIANYFNIYTDSRFILTSGIKAISFTTGNDTNEYTGFGFGFPGVNTSIAGQQFEIGDVVLLEGDWTNKPIPQYFEGMKSVGQDDVNGHKIEISSIGKNLCPIKDYTNTFEVGNISNSQFGSVIVRDIPVKPNTEYYLSCSNMISGLPYFQAITSSSKMNATSHVDAYHNGIREIAVKNTQIITQQNENYITLTTGNWFVTESDKVFSINDIQLEEVSSPTSYESYRIDKKEILLNEPLRALSDEVKDSIEKINGEWKIVRRCGEIVLNGSENWGTSGMTPQENTLIFQGDVISQLVKPNSSAKSDKFATYNGATTDAEGLLPFSGTGGTRIYFRISKSKLSSQDVAGFKQWLSQNPTKVVYELATPIMEDISPVTLQCWKNGTISIDEILPVESTHTVALNKPAQIKRNIEELTQLRNKVKSLEEQYDQIALEQAHQLELINHSFELDYI